MNSSIGHTLSSSCGRVPQRGSFPGAGFVSRRQGRGVPAPIMFLTLLALLLSAGFQSAAAGTIITNSAQVYSQGKNLSSAHNDVALVMRTPAAIELLRYAPAGDLQPVPQSEYSTSATAAGPFATSAVPAAYAGGPTLNLAQPQPLSPSALFHESDAIFVRLSDPDQNLYADRFESVLVTLTSSTGDVEVLRLYESGADSGVFTGYIGSTAAPAANGDGSFSIAVGGTINARYADIADQSDVSTSAGLFDPVGTVFDSSTGQPVDGITITLVDMNTGQPATVFGDDGVSCFPHDGIRCLPASVISGGSARDSSGRVYDFPPGGFRFPLMDTGNYRLALQTTSGWAAPSTVPTVQLQLLPGAPWAIQEGSRGEPFALAPVPVLRIDIPIDRVSEGLWISKRATKDVIGIGDFLPYQVTVTNPSNHGDARDVVVTDQLPPGFRYRSGSARLDGNRIANPAISADGRMLTFKIGTIVPQQSRSLTYVVETAAGAKPGKAVNSASASGQGGIVSNTAQATVKVTEDLFRSSSLIVGQVLDGCGDDAQGIPGVRIYLEDGSFVITDKDGLYHFEGIRPISHVVQLDTTTLPEGYAPVNCEDNTRFAGQNFSQFVDLQGGTMWRSDFYAGIPSLPPAVDPGPESLGYGQGAPSSGGSATLNLASTIEGQRVRYEIEINNENLPTENLRLAINLPPALAPVAGSTTIDGVPAGDPNLTNEQYTFVLSDLDAGGRHKVYFSAEIPEKAAGEMPATAVLHFDTSILKEQKTPEAVNSFTVARTAKPDCKEFVMSTHFDSGLADLTPADAKALAEFAKAIGEWQVERVELIGHTDNVPLSQRTARRFKDNPGLSHARANTVASFLASLLDLPANKVASTGKGDSEPIGDNRREAGRAANRRVEIRIYLCKDRVETRIESIQMNSGPQVATSGTLPMPHESDTLPSPVVGTAGSSAANPKEQSVGILSPVDGTVLTTSVSAVRIRLDSRLKPALLLDGNEIPADRIGFTLVDKETKSTLYSYIGIDFGGPGEHRLVLRGFDPFGNIRFEETAVIVRSGEIASIRLLGEGANTADGKTPVRVQVELRDASGQAIPAGVTLALVGGNLQPPRSVAPLEQTRLNTEEQVVVDRDGWVEFRPVTQSGAYRTHLVYNDNAAVEVETYVKPQMREWILVGLAEGTAGYNTVSGNMESLGDGDVEEAYYDDGRIAFFAKGRIKGEWLLTLSYDTAKPKQDKLHGTIDPDQYYTLYGDGTDQQYDAPSARKLYVKLERGQFYALFGDYDTGLTVTELASYSRSLNGFKSEMKSRYFNYNVFASETRQAFVRDEIPGDGTSGLYRLSRRDLVLNSEKIVIEIRDRFHSETVVDARALSRHLDYDIDYDAGTLFFKVPVASRDENFNPIFVVVDYEAADNRDAAMNYGGRAAIRPLQALEIGISHVHEGVNGAEGDLTAIDTTVKLGQSRLRAEAATSKAGTGIGTSGEGDAYLAELSHHGNDLVGRVYIREQESGFGLGQQRRSESGSRKLGGDASYRMNNHFSLMGEIVRQSMLDTGAERDLGQAEIKYQEKVFSLRSGLRQATDRTAAGETNRSTQLLSGGNWQATKKLNLRLTHDQSIFNEDESADYPTRTLVGADYLLSEKVAAFVEQEFSRSDAQKTEMTRAGLKTVPWTGAQMQSTIGQQGTEYGPRVFATTGLRQTWQIDKVWSADAGLDHSRTLRHPGATPINAAAPPVSGGQEDFTALSLGANRKAEKWTLSNRIEYRTSDNEDKLGLYSGAEGEIRRGLALSARFQLFDSHGSGDSRSLDGTLRLGAAYRPPQTRWIILDRLDFLFDRKETATDDFDNWRLVNIVSANYKPNRKTQVSLQYGAKYVQENIDGDSYNSYTDLVGVEGRYDFTKRWDLGVRTSVLHSWNANVIDYSAGASVGFNMVENAWISFGYNFTGFRDEDFSRADFTAKGPFMRFRVKFDQNSVRDILKSI